MNNAEIMEKLKAPFGFKDIEWRVGNVFTRDGVTKGLAMPYVTRTSIQKRLDEVFGFMGWKNEYKEWHTTIEKKGQEQVAVPSQLCGISVWNDATKEWVTKWDGAANTNFEGIKGGISDSFKRCATNWGIGRYLYDMNPLFVEVIEKGKGYVIDRNVLNTKVNDFYLSEMQRIFYKSYQKPNSNNNNIAPTNTHNQNTNRNNQNVSGRNNFTDGNNNSNRNTQANTNRNTNNNRITTNNNNDNNAKAPASLIGVLKTLITTKKTNIDSLLEFYQVNALEELSLVQAGDAINRLSKAA